MKNALRKPFLSIASLTLVILFAHALYGSMLMSQTVSTDPEHPNMYINQQEIDGIKQKLSERAEPWQSAFDKVIQKAN